MIVEILEKTQEGWLCEVQPPSIRWVKGRSKLTTSELFRNVPNPENVRRFMMWLHDTKKPISYLSWHEYTSPTGLVGVVEMVTEETGFELVKLVGINPTFINKRYTLEVGKRYHFQYVAESMEIVNCKYK